MTTPDIVHQAFYCSILVYNVSLAFTKASILLQYRRVFQTRRFRFWCNIVLVLVSIYGLWTTVSGILACWPIAYFWDKSIAGGNCLNEYASWFSNAGMNVITDFVIVLLPIPAIRHSKLPKRQRRLLMLVFGMAGT